MRQYLLILAMALGTGGAGAGSFEDHWYDGKAELSGYQIKISRYGEVRPGTAIMIYVTEPFSQERRVKTDRPQSGDINALKLNLVRDFQTGLYDYNTMVSVFSDDRDFSLSKISFSSADWCGHVFEEQLFYPGSVHTTRMSYFDHESGSFEWDKPERGITEDQLFILLRNLRGEFLNPGESVSLPFLPGPYWARLNHKTPQWTEATISRHSATETTTVPAGTFDTHKYTVSIENRQGVFHIENIYPHRVVKWSLAPDEEAVLTGSKRLPYWNLHDNGNESYLQELGLPSP